MSDYKQTRDAAGKVTTQYEKMLRNLDDDNLKERLTDMSVLASTRTPADALQYIEELEERLKAATDDAKEAEAYAGELEAVLESIKAKLAACEKYRDAYAECDRIGTQAVRDLEAKLAKAVTRLQHIAANKTTGELTVIEWDTYDMFTILDACISEARTTIAAVAEPHKLTGGLKNGNV